ncbi:hypothetical protein Catovirus_2_126 [Catovirus CTV1]|uniref:Uncharacterized protein n=1 Tax=Catovirus CTV1 TaxID=1977631 RepID=A0A1V0SBS9_9VIRU|nr:hypothetical protein Catovirus_2_126 [Catovirus CTV1]
MNKKPISINLKEIEKEMIEMENIDGIKKLVNKYNNLYLRIDDSKKELKQLTDSMIEIKDDENEVISENSSSDDNTSYVDNMSELERLNKLISDNIENMELEEIIEIYKKANKMISKCQKYLNEQKMEIINEE